MGGPPISATSASAPKADYEVISAYYEEVRPSHPEAVAPWVEALATLLGDQPGEVLLDVGTGTGRFAGPVGARCRASVVGIDTSAGMLRRAAAKDPQGLWVLGDAQALPVRSRAVGGAFLVMVLQHLTDRPRAIQELYRVLKPGGQAVAITISWTRLQTTPIGLFPGVRRLDRARFPSVPMVREWFAEAGFSPVGVRQLRIPVRGARVEEFVERARKRFVSTFALLDDRALEAGLPIFERRLRARFGQVFDYVNTFSIVWGRRPRAPSA